jgi:hypothetical protein
MTFWQKVELVYGQTIWVSAPTVDNMLKIIKFLRKRKETLGRKHGVTSQLLHNELGIQKAQLSRALLLLCLVRKRPVNVNTICQFRKRNKCINSYRLR